MSTLNEADEGYEFVPDKAKWDEVLAREDGRIVKAILHHLDPAEIDKIMQALEETGLFELTPSVMYGGELKNVEINRKGVHKGYALATGLSAQLGLDMNAVMAIGDSDNDLTHAANGRAGCCHGECCAACSRGSRRGDAG